MNKKNIISRFLLKLGIMSLFFLFINGIIYFYLKNFTIAFRPLDQKAKALLHTYSDSTIYIGGDSIAEEGIDPRIIDSHAINLAIAGGGIVGLSKAINIYGSHPLSSQNTIIINLSILNLNESIVHGNLYINQADTFLDVGIIYLINSWRTLFLQKYFYLVQCHYSSCPFTQDTDKTKDLFFKTLRKKGYYSRISSIESDFETKKTFQAQYKNIYQYNFDPNGEMFKSYQDNLKKLIQTNAKIAIMLMPISDTFKNSITEFGTKQNMQSFISNIQIECNKYSNCKNFNYIDWDNRKLGTASNTDLYFSDFMHLNVQGSTSFSTILKKDLFKNNFL
jgi:hypothetical protein